MIMTLTSSDWLIAEGWRQGLFSHCIGEHAPTPLPFNVPEREPNCYPARDEGKRIQSDYVFFFHRHLKIFLYPISQIVLNFIYKKHFLLNTIKYSIRVFYVDKAGNKSYYLQILLFYFIFIIRYDCIRLFYSRVHIR